MEKDMKGLYLKELNTEKEYTIMLMGINLAENGEMTEKMDKEYIDMHVNYLI